MPGENKHLFESDIDTHTHTTELVNLELSAEPNNCISSCGTLRQIL